MLRQLTDAHSDGLNASQQELYLPQPFYLNQTVLISGSKTGVFVILQSFILYLCIYGRLYSMDLILNIEI